MVDTPHLTSKIFYTIIFGAWSWYFFNNNCFWVESVDGGYNINYDAYMPIAGFQFNLSGIDDISDYEFVNGQVYATEFELQFKNNILLI